jgi:hypothetical protein
MWYSRLPPSISDNPYHLPLPVYTSIVTYYGTTCSEELNIKAEIKRDVERSVFGTTKPQEFPEPNTSRIINTMSSHLSVRSASTLSDASCSSPTPPFPISPQPPPHHPPFAVGRQTTDGVQAVERVLQAAAWCNKDVGYAQGMDYVAAHIWFVLKEIKGGEEGQDVEGGREGGEEDKLNTEDCGGGGKGDEEVLEEGEVMKEVVSEEDEGISVNVGKRDEREGEYVGNNEEDGGAR